VVKEALLEKSLDNVLVERLSRIINDPQHYIYLSYEVSELRRGLARRFASYNPARLHRAPGYETNALPCATMVVLFDVGLSLP
jgi:hypothetical protein